jgi:pimeloyl-ACP methyl ester carboxylesterase
MTTCSFQVYFYHKSNVFQDKEELNKVRKDSSLPLFCLCHGAGQSAQSFAMLARYLQSILECDILTWDCRGHGKSVALEHDDFSLATLTNDAVSIIDFWRGNSKQLVLMGHR